MKTTFWRLSMVFALTVCTGWISCYAQSPGAVWTYQLLDGSTILEDCPVCDHISIPRPLRGSFSMRAVTILPPFSVYQMENICFTNVQSPAGVNYKVTGQGIYQVMGEVAVRQTLTMELWIDNGNGITHCYLTNISDSVSREWPMLQIGVLQTNGTLAQQFSFTLNAAPFRELWFSAGKDFVAGSWGSASNLISKGDLLSMTGSRVKANQQLTWSLGIMPPSPDVGLKDLDIISGGEILFSIDQDIFSETLGQTLHEGDVLSSRGAVVRTNFDLIAAFVPQNLPFGGPGLAALRVNTPQELWFSVQSGFESRKLNAPITPGDLLSELGVVIRSNAQLLSRFFPVGLTNVPGLVAVYVWPSGEIWFSLDKGFNGPSGTNYEPGDLLSDQGYLVYSADELLSNFAPSPAATNVMIDALYIVTDTIPASPAPWVAPPQPTNRPPASLALSWQGEGNVFQLEAATNVEGSFSPLGPLSPDRALVDVGAQTNVPQRFYRVRQW